MQAPRRAVIVTSVAAMATAIALTVPATLTIPTAQAATDGGPGRYQAAGGYLDPGFGSKGSLTLPGGESIATGPKGSIWILGSVVYTDGVTRYLNRLTAAGKPDKTFTGPTQTSNATDLTTGPLITDPAGGASFAVNMCCRKTAPPTSQVAVHTVSVAGQRQAGRAGTTNWALANIVSKAPADADYVIGGVVRLSDTSLRACVSVYPGGDRDPFAALVGIRADGAIDTRVGAADTTMPAAGWTKLAGLDDCGFASAGQQQLFVDSSDRLYIAGTASVLTPVATRVLRTSAAGVLDPTYGTAGVATIKAPKRSYSPLTGVLRSDGVLFLGLTSKDGAAGSKAVATVVKLTAKGARDTAYGSNAVSRFFPSGGSSELDTVGFLPGDRLVIGLVYTSGTTRTGRLTAVSTVNGKPATTFGAGGTVVTGTLTWNTLVQGSYLVTIGNVLPANPAAFLGPTVLQRRQL